MGLDFQGSDAHWSYSGFNRFRGRLQSFYGALNWNELDTIEKARAALPTCPILPLLAHSDCDGELSPEECGQVSPVLRALVAFWPEDDYDRNQAEELCDGMDECVKENTPLIFC